jgi:hypothetical protein
MNRAARRVRDMINPYLAAFTTWWCHSGRYLRPPQMRTGGGAVARWGGFIGLEVAARAEGLVGVAGCGDG